MDEVVVDQLVREIRTHVANHPEDDAYDFYRQLKSAGRDILLLEVRAAWRRVQQEQ